MLNNKYLLAMMVAKRAKELKFGAKPLVDSKHRRSIIIALEEIKAGKIFIKEKEEPLKAKEIFNEVENSAKDEDISDITKEPEKPEGLSDAEKPLKTKELLNEDIT